MLFTRKQYIINYSKIYDVANEINIGLKAHVSFMQFCLNVSHIGKRDTNDQNIT